METVTTAWFDLFPAGKETSVYIGKVGLKVKFTVKLATMNLRGGRGIGILFLKPRC
jgi:hypothetical protein